MVLYPNGYNKFGIMNQNVLAKTYENTEMFLGKSYENTKMFNRNT